MRKEITIELRQRSVHMGDIQLGELAPYAPRDDRDPESSIKLVQDATDTAKELEATLNHGVSRTLTDGPSRGGFTTSFIENALIAFGAFGTAMTFVKIMEDVLLKWIENSDQRSARLKCDDCEVEIKGRIDIDKAVEVLDRLMARSGKKEDVGNVNNVRRPTSAIEQDNGEILPMSCRCCDTGQTTDRPRVCPECRHVFRGNGWGGIGAHWRAHHEDVMTYENFWTSLCTAHRGRRAPNPQSPSLDLRLSAS